MVDCDFFVVDLVENTCKMYQNALSLCISQNNNGTTIVYDKFLAE